MPTEYTYDYAIVRVVPRVERGEQMNVGVILSCVDETSSTAASSSIPSGCGARSGARPRAHPRQPGDDSAGVQGRP